MAKSIEEQIEDIAKRQLDLAKVEHYAKTQSINQEIDEALQKAPSKQGGKGNNYPDIKVLLETCSLRQIPVMIEAKGKKGDLEKLNTEGDVDNTTKDNAPNYSNIAKYAVNGAVHYAKAVIQYSSSYNEALAIGVNGYNENESIHFEIAVYYLSKDSLLIPQKLGEYTDLSFLDKKYEQDLLDAIERLNLSEEEVEKRTRQLEEQIEDSLVALNQELEDVYSIKEEDRVNLVSGLIIAGLGIENKVAPLSITDLKSYSSAAEHDGVIICNKIDAFLQEKNLPKEKKDVVLHTLETVFLHTDLHKVKNGESDLKRIYSKVIKLIPYFTTKYHVDFTGKLFNVLNRWVKQRLSQDTQNDVVLTPRYVCEMMAKLCRVNQDSYVWDYALGSGGFLISAMKLMTADAERCYKDDPEGKFRKILKIHTEQLLGVEKLSDVYVMAVLNMLLMKDGSANVLNKDSLNDFDGTYEQGPHKGEEFPATVFLLNPPYSYPGKGFIFVEKALSKMQSHGEYACVLIQENAGSGNGLPYTKRILEHNTLLASIHMPDIFKGVVGVQTAIYLFKVGIPHDTKQQVKFINFDNDGYARQNRKKAKAGINLRDIDHAKERYQEIVNVVLFGKKYMHYLQEKDYIEDTISLNGNDWTYSQHRKISTIPTHEDFAKVVKDYLAWRVGEVIKQENSLGKM
ncbi:MAG: N-6 DNA methylase [Prevotellaceae bacterium]|nr:N-6 DNA methylase [Candidatus Faecinaster equi]